MGDANLAAKVNNLIVSTPAADNFPQKTIAQPQQMPECAAFALAEFTPILTVLYCAGAPAPAHDDKIFHPVEKTARALDDDIRRRAGSSAKIVSLVIPLIGWEFHE